MSTWDMLANAAWLVSALIAIWMVVDLLKVGKEYPRGVPYQFPRRPRVSAA